MLFSQVLHNLIAFGISWGHKKKKEKRKEGLPECYRYSNPSCKMWIGPLKNGSCSMLTGFSGPRHGNRSERYACVWAEWSREGFLSALFRVLTWEKQVACVQVALPRVTLTRHTPARDLARSAIPGVRARWRRLQHWQLRDFVQVRNKAMPNKWISFNFVCY